MRSLLLAVILLVATASFAAEVTITGTGASTEEALQNAKLLATEAVAGTFITGREDLHNDQYSEHSGQYNGGVIQHYEVTSSSINNGLYSVTIHAEVDTSKINTVVVTEGAAAPYKFAPQVMKAASNYQRTLDAITAINTASPKFTISILSSSFALQGENTTLTYHLQITWTPKWVDDIKKLALLINKPMKLHFWSTPEADPNDSVVCFASLTNEQFLDASNCWAQPVVPKLKKEKLVTHTTIDGINKISMRSISVRHLVHNSNDSGIRLLEVGYIHNPLFVIYQNANVQVDTTVTVLTKDFPKLTSVEFETKE